MASSVSERKSKSKKKSLEERNTPLDESADSDVPAGESPASDLNGGVVAAAGAKDSFSAIHADSAAGKPTKSLKEPRAHPTASSLEPSTPQRQAAAPKRSALHEPLSVPEAFTKHIRAQQNQPPVPKNLLELLSEESCSAEVMLDALSSSGESNAYADELALVEDMIEYVISYPDDPLTLDQAMAVIEYVARADPAVHERLVARGAVAAVFVCMARGATDPDIQDWGCAAIWNMAYLPQHEANLLENSAPIELTRSMALFPTVPSLQERGCGALVAMACSAEGQAAVRAAGGLHVFLQHAQTSEHPAVKRWACAGLAACLDEESIADMVREGVVPTALHCVQSTLEQVSTAHAELRATSLELMHALSKFAASRSLLFVPECLTAICDSMRHDTSATVHGIACNALAQLVDQATPDQRRIILAADVNDAFQLVLETHTDARLHAQVRRALATLSGSYSSYAVNMLRSLVNRWMLS